MSLISSQGPNKGRHFYNCARTGTQRCSSFTWADKKPVAASTGGGERGREIVGRSAAAPVPRRGGKGGGGERKPLCKGHQEPCSLQITKKEVRGMNVFCQNRLHGSIFRGLLVVYAHQGAHAKSEH